MHLNFLKKVNVLILILSFTNLFCGGFVSRYTREEHANITQNIPCCNVLEHGEINDHNNDHMYCIKTLNSVGSLKLRDDTKEHIANILNKNNALGKEIQSAIEEMIINDPNYSLYLSTYIRPSIIVGQKIEDAEYTIEI